MIEELIRLAREMREAGARGVDLGLSEEELAFYDALETNDSAVQVLGDETLRDIARELVETVRGNVTIDWTLRENIRANLRRLVKRILRKHGYPPDKQEKATRTVLEQAEVLSEGWALAGGSLEGRNCRSCLKTNHEWTSIRRDLFQNGRINHGALWHTSGVPGSLHPKPPLPAPPTVPESVQSLAAARHRLP